MFLNAASRTKPRIVAGILMAAVLVFFGWNLYSSTFDASRWRSANTMFQTRNHMTQDLIDSRVLVGKSRDQVIELLGPVTSTDKFRDWDMVYVLGPQEGYMDFEWLALRTDGKGVISDQQIFYD